jgi:uncharacterized membrane protein
LKVTLVGGLLVVLPVWVSLLLLLKAIKSAMAMLLPIAKLLPQWFVHEKVAALGLLLVICFAVGLLIRKGLAGVLAIGFLSTYSIAFPASRLCAA